MSVYFECDKTDLVIWYIDPNTSKSSYEVIDAKKAAESENAFFKRIYVVDEAWQKLFLDGLREDGENVQIDAEGNEMVGDCRLQDFVVIDPALSSTDTIARFRLMGSPDNLLENALPVARLVRI
jgi:hypothetical protein